MDVLGLKPETIISYCALFIAFSSFSVAYVQMKLFNRQIRLDCLIRITAVNREILSLGFNDPELFRVLNGDRIDSEKEKRYLQLWLNQIENIWQAQQSQLFQRDHFRALRRDIADMFQLKSMQEHWRKTSQYYSVGFCLFIDQIIRDAAPAPSAPSFTSLSPAPVALPSKSTVPVGARRADHSRHHHRKQRF